MATTASILGLDTAAGAYLARLLGARGYIVRGTGGAALLDRLGIAGDVTADERPVVTVDELYDLRGDPAATRALLAEPIQARVFVAADPDDAALIEFLAAERTAGRFVATGRVYPNESRLGPGTSPVARIVAAAASGTNPHPADLVSTTDCGWTPEYVDAMRLMLALLQPDDLVVASGTVVTGNDVWRIAADYFKRPSPAAAIPASAVPAGLARPAPGPARAALGWRAVTVGDELVSVLCEGHDAR